MKIAVIAANGRLGKIFVEEALRKGHFVHAGVRGENTLNPHPKLEIIKCDATKADELRILLKNQDVVVSALGHVKTSAPDVQTIATRMIISVMQELRITRFIDVTGTGVRFPDDKISFIDHILNLGVRIADPSRVKDGRDHMELLKNSTLEWTSIRVLKLQNVRPKTFELKLHGPTKWYVGRSEVATAMLQVIEQKSFLKQAPILSD